MIRNVTTKIAKMTCLVSRSQTTLSNRLFFSSTSESFGGSKPSAQDYIDMEEKHGAHNYHPLPVVLAKGTGAVVEDVEGKTYLDFLSAYSAVNQGHCHPRLVEVVRQQVGTLTLTSRAFHNNYLGPYAKFMHEAFGYDKVLPMNSGVEGGETAVKIARKWAYEVKGVPSNQATVLFANNNFWGRSIAACSSSSSPDCYHNYGPFTPGFELIPYNDIEALRKALEANPNVAAFYVEPVQGEAGVIVPDAGYLTQVRQLCTKHNVLFIADEIQTGLSRCGTMLCVDGEKVRPDMVVLGKALSGGMMPISAVLTDDHIMKVITPGTHGSTYGGNPLACRVAIEAVKILQEERLSERAHDLGVRFRQELNDLKAHFPWIKNVRGKGLLNALEVDSSSPADAWEICMLMKDKGILAKPTHETTIRFAPPLVITDAQFQQGLSIIHESCQAHDNKINGRTTA
eukprot:TRINITY_DN3781_c0_g1_i1.p1 TRINITY_DN3781_c0_g1~~TRINITY_DN3781_c0_g1_i1.p1  ORF type:complete len:536 (+),score=214.81 TRINITY_DN3781_c0_g1_i1:242-1609(+)